MKDKPYFTKENGKMASLYKEKIFTASALVKSLILRVVFNYPTTNPNLYPKIKAE